MAPTPPARRLQQQRLPRVPRSGPPGRGCPRGRARLPRWRTRPANRWRLGGMPLIGALASSCGACASAIGAPPRRALPSRTRGGQHRLPTDRRDTRATLPHAGGTVFRISRPAASVRHPPARGGTGGMRRTNRARGNHTGSGCGARPAARGRPTRRSWRWRIRGWGAPGGGTPSGRSQSIPSRGAWRPERGIDARAWGAPCSMRPRGWRARWPWRGGQVMRNRGRRSSSVRPRRGMLRGMPCAVGTWRASANRHRWAGTGAAVR